jgi:hypothetical protein
MSVKKRAQNREVFIPHIFQACKRLKAVRFEFDGRDETDILLPRKLFGHPDFEQRTNMSLPYSSFRYR